MKQTFLFAVSILLLVACKKKDDMQQSEQPAADTTATTTNEVQPPGMKLLWQTEATLTTSESVLYDATNNLLYVSCIGAVPPDAKDKDGFISKVGLDGKILTLKWVTGLNAPKGMGISGNTLYVTDIDRLVAIDITTGKIAQTYNIPGAKFLNDVSIASDGTVYFSDSGTKIIHALINGNVETFMGPEGIAGVNGVHADDTHLYVAGYEAATFFRINRSTKAVEQIATEIPYGDGVEPYKGHWLVSNWNGEIHHVTNEGEVFELLDSQEAKLNTADIEVIADKNLLLIPTFFGNNVSAYELTTY